MAWSRLNWWQFTIFVISFLCITSRHIAILGWAMVKPKVSETLDFSSTQLGIMDTAYLLCYGFGNMLNGNLGDSYPLKKVVSLGLLFTAGVLIATATLGYFHINFVWLFALLWAGNGLFQSSVWPGTVALIGNWFPRLSRGRVMGVWSSNSSVGDVIGAELAGVMLATGWRWEFIVLTTAAIIVAVSCTFAAVVEDKPALDLVEADATCDKEFSLLIKHKSSMAKRGIRFAEAWKIPRVLPYALTYACVKLLTYGMLFWLPFFLTKKFNLTGETVGIMTATFAIGGITGGSLSGWLTDHMKGNRSIVLMPMLALTLPLLFLFEIGSNDTIWMFYVIIPLTGVMNAGASNLMSSAVPADLAERCETTGTEEAKGTVTGIMNGTGALGAASGGVLIGWLQTFGWNYVFMFLMAVSALAALLVTTIAIEDYRDMRKEENQKKVLEL